MECCVECEEACFNVDSSVECSLTGETVYTPCDSVGAKCPKRGGAVSQNARVSNRSKAP